MKLRAFNNFVFITITILLSSSCVSKRKYIALQKEFSLKEESFKSEKSQYLSVNDSLKYMLLYKDSLIDSLNYKLNILLVKKEKNKTSSFSYKKSTMSREQECEKKSLFIYNFTKHIEWPIEFNGTEFIIAVAGDEKTIKQLDNFMNQKKVSGKKIIVEKYKKGARYNLVYITYSDSNSFQEIKNAVRKNKTLIVTDDLTEGSHISFSLDQDKVKYTVNKPAIEKTGLKVGQELLRYAG
jgi:hypothetical protein